MEALSGIASGMAVVSLAIQLVGTVSTIKTFIRNVKDSRKELERLIDLLERLEGLLEDIRDLLERQSSMGHYLPMPSMTIFRNLQSCEKTLQTLNELVEKLGTSMSLAGTASTRLKSGLKIGMKTKGIADMEVRIDREINYLHICLGANLSAISLQAFPALIEGQNTIMTLQQSLATYSNSKKESTVITRTESIITSCQGGAISCGNDDNLLDVVSTHISVRTTMMQSYLNRFGLYQRKKTGRMLVPSKSRNKGPCEEVALWEDDETSLLWSMLGYGFTWTQHRSYGKLLPSLSVFPVVSSYANELDSVLEFDDLRSFQQLISSGTVHPFQRDEHGWSLLHYAAWHNRVDICQLLKAYGVKSDTTYSGTTELYLAIRPIHTLGCEDQIATFRCFLNDDEPFIENFGHDSWVYLAYQVEDDTLEWLVQQIGRLLPLEESINIRQSVTRGRWRQLSSKFEKDPLMKHPKLLLTKNFLRHVKLDQFPILEDLFSGCCNVPDSYIVGAVFIEWLKASDVNVEEYMKLFLKDAEIGTVEDKDRDIVFETYGEGDWRLGFKWVFDPEASGYHLVSEHQALGCCRRSLRLTYPGDEVYKYNWPFIGELCDEAELVNMEARFARRIANKARKKRARSGQKVTRSKMPGTWVW